MLQLLNCLVESVLVFNFDLKFLNCLIKACWVHQLWQLGNPRGCKRFFLSLRLHWLEVVLVSRRFRFLVCVWIHSHGCFLFKAILRLYQLPQVVLLDQLLHTEHITFSFDLFRGIRPLWLCRLCPLRCMLKTVQKLLDGLFWFLDLDNLFRGFFLVFESLHFDRFSCLPGQQHICSYGSVGLSRDVALRIKNLVQLRLTSCGNVLLDFRGLFRLLWFM